MTLRPFPTIPYVHYHIDMSIPFPAGLTRVIGPSGIMCPDPPTPGMRQFATQCDSIFSPLWTNGCDLLVYPVSFPAGCALPTFLLESLARELHRVPQPSIFREETPDAILH